MSDPTLDNSVEVTEELTAPVEGQPEVVTDSEPTSEETTNDHVEVTEGTNEDIPLDELIAGKFKTQEDLLTAYNNLETKLGEQSQEVNLARTTQQGSQSSTQDNTQVKEQLEEQLPQDVLDEMISDYQSRKSDKQNVVVQKINKEDFDKAVAVFPHLSEQEKVLLSLCELPQYKSTPFHDIFKEHFGDPVKANVDERKKSASSVTSKSASPKQGGGKWTEEKIKALSKEEYDQKRPEILAHYQSQSKK